MKSFYKKYDITSFENRNVMYVAFVGRYKTTDLYKYGKSVNVYEREYTKHRKAFDMFDMQYIKGTDNKDIVENLFKKELKIRDLHRTMIINNKKQTELFTVTEDYDYNYIINLLNRLIKNNPSYEVKKLTDKLKLTNQRLKILYSEYNK